MKTGSTSKNNLQEALEVKEHAPSELGNEICLLRALDDTARQLSGLEDIREAVETFLLMILDTFAISHGFVMVIDTEALNGQIVTRGLEDSAVTMLNENIPEIVNQYSDAISQHAVSSEVEPHMMAKEAITLHGLYPPRTDVVVHWTIGKKYVGLVGLGEKIKANEYSETEREILLSFTHHLVITLKNAMSMGVIRELNVDLNEKNIELEKALTLRAQAQQELDKRLFHLVILYDTSRELSGIKETETVMDTFLLMTMGTFSAAQGYVLLLNKNDKTARVSVRGVAKEEVGTLSEDDIEKAIIKLFDAVEARKMAPMDVQVVVDKGLLDTVPISIDALTGLVFVMNEATIGVIGLGEKMTPGDYSAEDQELLLRLGNNFTLFLENSRSFETIQKLNVDLEKRNIELRKTIDDLRASKHKVEVLERTKARVKAAIQKEMERTGRVSVMDFLSILGIGLILGLIFNFANPSGISLIPLTWLHKSPPLIEVQLAKTKYDSKTALLVDARPQVFYNQRHIPGAVNLPLSLFDFIYMMRFSNIDSQKEIIVYGKSFSRQYDKEVALKLTARGHTNVMVLAGTLSVWGKEGYPLGP